MTMQDITQEITIETSYTVLSKLSAYIGICISILVDMYWKLELYVVINLLKTVLFY